MEREDAYAAAGVHVGIEAQASRIMFEASRQTWKNRKGLIGDIINPFADFAGLRMVSVESLPQGSYMSVGFDTAGTKVEIAERVGKHDTIAFDLLAMVCDDAVLRGGEPVLVGTNLDLSSLGSDERYLPVIRELATGYVAAANAAGVAIINGEIAQMGKLVSGWDNFPYHWGASCVWFGKKENLFTGREVEVGDAVVMLKDNGFRTNGLTLARTIFAKKYGEEWHKQLFDDSTLGMHVLTPSTIYSCFVTHLNGTFDREGVSKLHGVVHITGGGIPEKLQRVLKPSGFGANLSNLFSPAHIVTHCQEVGEVSDKDAYGAWHMGQGMGLITPQPDIVLKEAQAFGIEARVAGHIVSKPGIRLVSKGAASPGEDLVYHSEA
ncbi:MAG TPA: AIR synthase-related protein [Candidatus Paceibacterota bacterium]|nr:AIR synthase-related protein [Candidatus Paceibacterota bacterium]